MVKHNGFKQKEGWAEEETGTNLDIAVADADGVEILDSRRNLPQDAARTLLCEVAARADLFKQFAACHAAHRSSRQHTDTHRAYEAYVKKWQTKA